jgi:hypothetical protein
MEALSEEEDAVVVVYSQNHQLEVTFLTEV